MELRDLTRALAANKNVKWSNDGYFVEWQGNTIVCVHEKSRFQAALHTSELKDCYIKEETQ